MEKDQAFIEMILKELAVKPDEIKIDRKVDDMGVLLTVTEAAPEDLSVFIGKGGETAKALRQLLRVVGYQQKARVTLKIETPQQK